MRQSPHPSPEDGGPVSGATDPPCPELGRGPLARLMASGTGAEFGALPATSPVDPVLDSFERELRLAAESPEDAAEMERIRADYLAYLEARRADEELQRQVAPHTRLDECRPLPAVERDRLRTLLERIGSSPHTSPLAGLARGCAWYLVGEPERALAAFDRLVGVLEDGWTLRGNRGLCLLELGRFHEACHLFDSILTRLPNHALAHRGRGRALLGMEHPLAAIVAFQRALELEPGDADTHYRLGKALLRAGRATESTRSLELAHRAEPEDLDVLHQLARAKARCGQWQEAADALDRALVLARGREPEPRSVGPPVEALGSEESAGGLPESLHTAGERHDPEAEPRRRRRRRARGWRRARFAAWHLVTAGLVATLAGWFASWFLRG